VGILAVTRGHGCRRLALLLLVLLVIELLLTETSTLQSLQLRASRAATQRHAYSVQSGPQAELLALASQAASRSATWTGADGRGRTIVLTVASSSDASLLSSYLGHASAAGVLPALVVVVLDGAAAELAARRGALVHRSSISPSAGPTPPLFGSDGHEAPSAHHASDPPLRAASRRAVSLAWRHASVLLAAGFSVWVADPRVVWRRPPQSSPAAAAAEGPADECDAAFLSDAPFGTRLAVPRAASTGRLDADDSSRDGSTTAENSGDAVLWRDPAVSPALSYFRASASTAAWLAATANALDVMLIGDGGMVPGEASGGAGDGVRAGGGGGTARDADAVRSGKGGNEPWRAGGEAANALLSAAVARCANSGDRPLGGGRIFTASTTAAAGSDARCPRPCVLPVAWFPNWLRYSQQRVAPDPVAVGATWLPPQTLELRLREEGLWAGDTGGGQRAGGSDAVDTGGGVRVVGGSNAANTGVGPGVVGGSDAANTGGGHSEERFLAYHEVVLSNGLSNAYNALRSALAIAQLTNRTLILPRLSSRHLHGAPYAVDAGHTYIHYIYI